VAGLQFGLRQSGKSIFLGERIFPLCLRLSLFLARAQKGVWGMNARGLLDFVFGGRAIFSSPHEYIHDIG
jgi:hypothetical protein